MDKLKKIGRVVIPAAAILLPFVSLALDPLPTSPSTDQPWTVDRLENLIERIGNGFIFVAVIIAVIFIIWGGVMYMAARGNEEQATKAKSTIFNGIIGAAVVLGVGVILQTLAGLITRSFFA